MRDVLLYTALAAAITGILLLSYAQDRILPPISRVSDLTHARVGENVRILGNVTRQHEFEGGSVILTVSDATASIDVYLPHHLASQLEGRQPTSVEVIGSMKIYKGRREIVVEDLGGLTLLQ